MRSSWIPRESRLIKVVALAEEGRTGTRRLPKSKLKGAVFWKRVRSD